MRTDRVKYQLTTAENSLRVFRPSTLVYLTDQPSLMLHDGVTIGGSPVGTGGSGGIAVRDPSVIYADGVMVQDTSGLYRGDDVTPGGVLLAGTGTLSVVANPTITPNGGSIEESDTITLATATVEADIRYTTDGTTPSSTVGTFYVAPFTLAATATVKCIAFKPGWSDSAVVSADFTVAAGIPRVINRPAGMIWNTTACPDFTVIYDGAGNYSTSIDWTFYTNQVWDLVLYVDAINGLDSNNGSTALLAKKTLAAAITAGEATSIYKLILAPGCYQSNLATLTKRTRWECPTGRAFITNGGKGGNEAVSSSGATYKWTGHVAVDVIDYGITEADGRPERLTLAANLSACQSTPGSWFADATDTYVHLTDGRQPDVLVASTTNAGTTRIFDTNFSCTCLNLTFFAGNVNSRVFSSYPTPFAFFWIFENCDFVSNGTSNNQVCLQWNCSTGFGALIGCRWWSQTQYDGVNGSTYSSGTIKQGFGVLELNCKGYDCGMLAGTATNITTTHFGMCCIRVGGEYYNAGDRIVHDVGVDTHSWLVGCHAATTVRKTEDAAYSVGEISVPVSKMWLDACTIGEGTVQTALRIYAGSEMYYANMDISGWTVVGTPVPYTP